MTVEKLGTIKQHATCTALALQGVRLRWDHAPSASGVNTHVQASLSRALRD